MIRGYLIGGAIAAFVVATAAMAAQTAPPPGVAQGTAPAPMAARPPLPPVAPIPPMVAPRMIVFSDHVMTRDEVAKHVAAMFAKLDTNHDGFITKGEVEAIHQKMMGAMGMARDMATRFHEGGMPMPDRGAMFDRLDANHDGVISRQEFMAAKPEVREERMMIMRDGASSGPGQPPMPPMDGNKMEFRFEHRGPMHGGMGMHTGMGMDFAGHLFEMADANHDGRVSLQEAQAAAFAHFDKADLNHDGKITPDERRRMHQTMRTERRTS